jgi:hypothetical protein
MKLCELIRGFELLFPKGNCWFYLPALIFFSAMLIIWTVIVPLGLAAFVGYGYLSHYYPPDVVIFPYAGLINQLSELAEIIFKITAPYFGFSVIVDIYYALKQRGVIE